MTLLELAERCEGASGPDRELDAHVARQAGWRFDVGPGGWIPPFGGMVFSVPNYTASLDAAMMLVPEGWITNEATESLHSRRWTWRLYSGDGRVSEARAATPALALTAASLRARSDTPS